MTTKAQVDKLWRELRQAINATYAESGKDANCLRDYAENISWSDDLAGLLGRESANERKHRSNRPAPRGFSVETAAKLLLLTNAASGAAKPAIPSATDFLTYRQTSVEASVIGWLVRKHLTDEWKQEVAKLDYAKLMQA